MHWKKCSYVSIKNQAIVFKAERYIYNLNVALEGVFQNRFRSLLTALGIIFGVAAVIAMLAIGSGARHEILEQMKLVGVNNIIVRPLQISDNDDLLKGRFSPGLTLEDAISLQEVIPTIQRISPETTMNLYAMNEGIRQPVRLSGVTPDLFTVFNLSLWQGRMFTGEHLDNGDPVAIIGSTVRSVFFGNQDPIGQQIKCGNVWLTVIGVAENRAVAEETTEDLGVSDFNNVIYIPVRTLLLRYEDRSFVSASDIQRARAMSRRRTQDNEEKPVSNYNQLDRIVIQVEDTGQLTATAELVKRILKRRHNNVEDFEVIIPELLLQQEQRTKDIFNIVLGAIAGISLLVGGIGIMNIMLASVVERTREIGVRLAVGAKKEDVVLQFLSEAILISITGGIAGIFLGLFISRAIMQIAGILTIVTLQSIIISFGVAALVGIVFGYMPARKAAQKDPVESLRYE